MSDSKIVNLRLSAKQESILNALTQFRASGADPVSTWSGTVANRSEYIRSLIREDYKRAVTEGMKPITGS